MGGNNPPPQGEGDHRAGWWRGTLARTQPCGSRPVPLHQLRWSPSPCRGGFAASPRRHHPRRAGNLRLAARRRPLRRQALRLHPPVALQPRLHLVRHRLYLGFQPSLSTARPIRSRSAKPTPPRASPHSSQQPPGHHWRRAVAASPGAGQDDRRCCPHMHIEVETNGTVAPPPALDALIHQYNVSPKLAHSGNAGDLAPDPRAPRHVGRRSAAHVSNSSSPRRKTSPKCSHCSKPTPSPPRASS